MLRLSEYTQESRNAILVRDEFVVIAEREDDSPQPAPDDGEDDALAILAMLGIAKPYIEACSALASRYGTTLEEEILASGLVREDAYFGALARYLRLPFLAQLEAAHLSDMKTLDTQLRESRMVRLRPRNERPFIATVPDLLSIHRFKRALCETPSLADNLVVTTPAALRSAVWQAGAERRLRETIHQLVEDNPRCSARIVLEGRQGFYLGAGAATLSILLVFFSPTLQIVHFTTATLYIAAVLFRFAPLRAIPPRKTLALLQSVPEDNLPVYSVLVALYREEAVVEQLVQALERLDWPKSRLDIKLVCEADDSVTQAAIDRQQLGRHFEVVLVPPAFPRTKPKALNYALVGARGEFVAVYDAEDRPHRSQLREAYAQFRQAPETVACLQAPLIISNADTSCITASFALEYSALFRRMLPMLARTKMPLPLGGTSNHFRTALLRKVGGWDPFNVTEDADLGLRLYRFGYRCGVIDYPTLEDAPTDLTVWMNQRTRWFKGWLQTWLVMTRSPLRTGREMGWRAYCVFHLLVGGMLLASLSHPFFLTYLIWIANALYAEGLNGLTSTQLALFATDAVTIVGSYSVFLKMGLSGMISYERKLIGRRWLFTPIYWLMLSAAAWRAVYELRYKPFVWNKTPHNPSAKPS